MSIKWHLTGFVQLETSLVRFNCCCGPTSGSNEGIMIGSTWSWTQRWQLEGFTWWLRSKDIINHLEKNQHRWILILINIYYVCEIILLFAKSEWTVSHSLMWDLNPWPSRKTPNHQQWKSCVLTRARFSYRYAIKEHHFWKYFHPSPFRPLHVTCSS